MSRTKENQYNLVSRCTKNRRGTRAACVYFCGSGIAQSVWRLATDWTVRGSNTGRDEIFRTCPDRRWGSSNLHTGYHFCFPGVERTGCDINHPPPPFSAEVKERVELYLYFPSGTFMACSCANFTFTLLSAILRNTSDFT